MILSDKEGQEQLDALIKNLDNIYLTDWEQAFLSDLSYKGLRFFQLANKQKQIIAKIHEDRIMNG